MKRNAFTMIELVFVIIVLGILAAMALPRMQRDTRQEAADNILSAIRYTQHLALMDNKANINVSPAVNWQMAFWQMRFANYGGEWQYIVASNTNYGTNLNASEAATDPTTGKLMYTNDASIGTNESPLIFLSKKYGINNVDFSGCNGQTGASGTPGNDKHIAFDYLGRLHRGVFAATDDMSTLMHADCTIRFQFEDGSEDLNITILKDTGYAYIVGQNQS
jgi:prepilin-type N-terminal cleavage/methylation domain-containing protein